jgi:hypothetical protein
MSSIFAGFSEQQLKEIINMYGISSSDETSSQLELTNK